MGRTLAPFRPALDFELQTWNEYRRGLRPENRIYFDRVAQTAKKYADAGSLAGRPLISEVIFFSAAIEQEKHIDSLKSKLEVLETQMAKLEQEMQQMRLQYKRKTEVSNT